MFHCLVIKVLNLPPLRQLIYFTTSFSMCQVLFSSFFKPERRRRDLNPRAAINDLLPFQGSPFGQLGYFSKLPYAIASHFFRSVLYYIALFFICQELFWIIFILNSGESGIRTHAPLRTNGFQDRLVMTTSIPLHIFICDVRLPERCLTSITPDTISVKSFFYFLQKNLKSKRGPH